MTAVQIAGLILLLAAVIGATHYPALQIPGQADDRHGDLCHQTADPLARDWRGPRAWQRGIAVSCQLSAVGRKLRGKVHHRGTETPRGER